VAVTTTNGPDEETIDGASPSPGRSPLVAVGLVVAGLLVGAGLGLVVGWKVEQQRVKEDIVNIRPVGTVTAVTDSSLTMDLLTSTGVRVFSVSDATVFDGGDQADVVEGSIVLVKSRAGEGGLRAVEVVLLPATTTFGKG
jgi:hypothetical protein